MNPARKVFIASALAAVGLVLLLLWKPSPPPTEATSTRTGTSTSATNTTNPAPRPPPRGDRPLVVYCAAGLKAPVETVAREYEARYGTTVQLQFGGSGTLLSNLRVARTGDLFIAADDSFVEIARSNHLVAEVIPLARQTPVLAVRRDRPQKPQSLSDLTAGRFQIGMANPEAAAVGKVARAALQKAGRWDALQPAIKVFKPTVNDVAADVKLGTVDGGIIWDSTTAQYPELEAVRLPEFEGATSSVSIAVLSFCDQPAAALRFARYLGGRDAGLPAFAQTGFAVVRGDVWSEQPEVLLFSGGVNRVAIEDTVRAFETREGVRVSRVYNGCGILTAQIRSGQRPDAYFACDVSFMTTVSNHFTPSVDLSETRMVILVQKGNPKGLSGLKDLAQPGLKLGLANEQQSALGSLTARLLRAQGLYDSVQPNVRVQTPTADLLVNQIRTGSLDAVVVYLANASGVRDLLEILPLSEPEALAIQPFAIGRNSDHAQLMERLLVLLRSVESRNRFEKSGFRWRDVSP